MPYQGGKDGIGVYIYYTLHKDTAGSVLVTELKLTSYPNTWQIKWKNQMEDALFKLCNPILKFPPIAQRSYDDQTKIWTYIGSYGPDVLQKIKTTTSVLGGVTQIEVPDLASIAIRASFDPKKISQSVRPEDFFYNPTGNNAAASSALTKESIQAKLASLLEISEAELGSAASGELKKLYRRAALKYHPDRNNGDGSKMSELNMLWGVWNA